MTNPDLTLTLILTLTLTLTLILTLTLTLQERGVWKPCPGRCRDAQRSSSEQRHKRHKRLDVHVGMEHAGNEGHP